MQISTQNGGGKTKWKQFFLLSLGLDKQRSCAFGMKACSETGHGHDQNIRTQRKKVF